MEIKRNLQMIEDRSLYSKMIETMKKNMDKIKWEKMIKISREKSMSKDS